MKCVKVVHMFPTLQLMCLF